MEAHVSCKEKCILHGLLRICGLYLLKCREYIKQADYQIEIGAMEKKRKTDYNYYFISVLNFAEFYQLQASFV